MNWSYLHNSSGLVSKMSMCCITEIAEVAEDLIYLYNVNCVSFENHVVVGWTFFFFNDGFT